MYPEGTSIWTTSDYTPNSRASYPLTLPEQYQESCRWAVIRKTILFLTADANGVLPPVAKLTPEQAMLWFLMGYTSKLAGTETGIVDPVSTVFPLFRRTVHAPQPGRLCRHAGRQMKQTRRQVYLVNTGWSGGPFGVGARMDIDAYAGDRPRGPLRRAGGRRIREGPSVPYSGPEGVPGGARRGS